MARRPHLNNTAEFLDWAIDRANLTDKEFADALGVMKPGVITMMRRGQVKLPLQQVPAIARAVDVDPAFMLRMALAEYMPEVFEVMVETFGKPLSENERLLVECYRRVSPNDEIVMDRDTQALIVLTLDSRRIYGRLRDPDDETEE